MGGEAIRRADMCYCRISRPISAASCRIKYGDLTEDSAQSVATEKYGCSIHDLSFGDDVRSRSHGVRSANKDDVNTFINSPSSSRERNRFHRGPA